MSWASGTPLPPQSTNELNEQNAEHCTSSQSDRLIVFARFPEPGQAKTRLIPALGQERAALLQAAMTRNMLRVAQSYCSGRPCAIEVRFAGGDLSRMRSLFGSQTRFTPQQGADLGERLEHAISMAFIEGVKRVVVIGTDCPELGVGQLQDAFEALLHKDVVLGPAFDGGYYLIGVAADRPELFRGIDWSTANVSRQTLKNAQRAQCSVQKLESLSDVDVTEDLLACRRVKFAFDEVLPQRRAGLLSIIIPTVNEEEIIESTLSVFAGIPDIEVIVADGESTDRTVDIARRLGTQIVSAARGRGRQMNAGAAMARGEVLLFLHADTKLPHGFRDHVWSTLENGAVAGAFPLRIDGERSGLRWIEWGANLRARYFQMPYGDQGIFVNSEAFHRIGGFPNWPLMEDYELCRRLRRNGRVRLAPEAVVTSARRWMSLGLWRTTLINQLCIVGFRLGVSPERLAQFYSSRLRRKR